MSTTSERMTEAPMTGDEIVELCRRHTLFEWSAQSAVDPIPVARAQRHLLLDAGRKALHRLQQPIDVRQHRAWRRASGARHSGTGGGAALRESVHGHRSARASEREARRDYARRHRCFLLHQRRRRGKRECDSHRAHVQRSSQDWRALSLVSRRHRGRADA